MKKNIQHILIIAFIIRVTLLIINNYFFILPQGDGDALVVEKRAFLYADSINLDYGLIFSKGDHFLAYLGSFIYRFTGRVPILFGLLMVFLGTIVVKKIYIASLLLWNNQSLAIKVAWLAALFPQFCLHSALTLRETPINLLLTLVVISFIKYWKYSQNKHLFWFIFYIIFTTLFHTGILFTLIGFLIFTLINSNNFQGRKSKFSHKIVILFVITCSILFINYWSLGLNKIGGSFENVTSHFETMEGMTTRGAWSYPNWMRITNGVNDFWKVPIRYITFLFSPLIPFLIKTPIHIIGLIDAFLYVLLFKSIYRNRKLILKIPVTKGILVMSIVLTLVFSLGVSNVGTAIRHRAKITPLFLILFIPKLNTIKSSKNHQA